MRLLGPVVSKPYAYSGENPWISVDVYCCFDLDLVDVYWVVQQMYQHAGQNLPNPKMTFCVTFKISNVKSSKDSGDLDKVKVKHVQFKVLPLCRNEDAVT